ncbi:MAG: SDR family NAD(P)-dependent oxidoreductase [Trueperaceae bacterium]|nr:SDR family NAD(P)-dependent oxidoreductase [Trueperaceae bacterium]MCO5172802.1 SDR family NAD(P)-dependent oxidoreductase [Trueperaceae bacterium]MCW5819944.1 SDR family NAD(P)-dependent oxidoreductase [Trueperaceae bacterium]
MLETTSDRPRTALVTGAGGDLAATVVPRLVAAGWRVVATVRPGSEERATERFAGLGEAVTVAGVDLVEPAAVAEAVARLDGAYGAPEALVHLAGRFEPGPGPADGALGASAVLERALDGNLRGAVNACAAVLPGMLAAGRGALVAVGAAAGASPAPGSVAYAAAKGALAAYFRSLAAQVAKRGVNVALLVPKGAFDTPGNRRAMPGADPTAWIAPDALTDAVLFLLDRPPRGLVHELPLSVG